MTSSDIRQSFLDFFKSKHHTVVPSSSLLPDSPNLLFTNAGMNQFVPIFLGQQKPNVSQWPGAIPGLDTRAADTQKCIRAGGKHNDLEDVGLDTYHHTFFEMLGNWSFGDYFKKEAIEWAWELVAQVWRFPSNRLYATVYKPGPGEPSEFDQEAYDHWTRLFTAAGLDPQVHICTGGKQDNFWMMGDTGPCGPCSELHVDLTPNGDTKGALVNHGSAQCIEIWNLVFMQFNANPDGTFSPLPAKSVDTGMGFERVTGIIQNTKGFTDFNRIISNYETDIFRPIFDKLEQMSGSNYGSTLPTSQSQISNLKSQIAIDVAFRVIADHIRTLSFAIANGIQPGNTDRNYVLRRILRRAVRYGRTLGFHEPFFFKLVEVLAATMGDVFPEIRTKKNHVREVIRVEEEAFNKTLDSGLRVFNELVQAHSDLDQLASEVGASAYKLSQSFPESQESGSSWQASRRELETLTEEISSKVFCFEQGLGSLVDGLPEDFRLLSSSASNVRDFVAELASQPIMLADDRNSLKLTADDNLAGLQTAISNLMFLGTCICGEAAFLLYDTYGFPLDLTELMARERGWTVDTARFEQLMERQRARARAAQKKEVIEVSQIKTQTPTTFVGYDKLETPAKVLEVVSLKDQTAVILDTSACYAEMGGQVGDTGVLFVAADWRPPPTPSAHGQSPANASSPLRWRVVNTQKSGNTWLHLIGGSPSAIDSLAIGNPPEDLPPVGSEVLLTVDAGRRRAIQRHHTVTHLLHWALHEIVSRDVAQKGSFVGPDKLTFDFNSAPLSPDQIRKVEELVNERILENAGVSWTEVPYAEVKKHPSIRQFFGEKYADIVRVVQIGGQSKQLDGYSMELCGGTHCRATGEIGLFRIVAENAIAAGVRRIEAIAGLEACRQAYEETALLKMVADKVSSPVPELEKKIDHLLEQQKTLEKQLKTLALKQAAEAARGLVAKAKTINGTPAIIENLGTADGDTLQAMVNELKGQFKGVVVLGGVANGAVALVASVSSEFTARVHAGKLIQQIAPIVGGKGGGKPDNARGGGKDVSKLDEALAKARTLF